VEEQTSYLVEITPEAEHYYFNLLEYLYKTHTSERASNKSDEILDMAMSLVKNPHRGSRERRLDFLGKEHRFLLYEITSRKQVKIIYFIDEPDKTVYVTDFFGTELDDRKISKRNKPSA